MKFLIEYTETKHFKDWKWNPDRKPLLDVGGYNVMRDGQLFAITPDFYDAVKLAGPEGSIEYRGVEL